MAGSTIGAEVGDFGISALPADHMVIGVLMIAKTIDDCGDEHWHTRVTPGLGRMEMIGALRLAYELEITGGVDDTIHLCDEEDEG